MVVSLSVLFFGSPTHPCPTSPQLPWKDHLHYPRKDVSDPGLWQFLVCFWPLRACFQDPACFWQLLAWSRHLRPAVNTSWSASDSSRLISNGCLAKSGHGSTRHASGSSGAFLAISGMLLAFGLIWQLRVLGQSRCRAEGFLRPLRQTRNRWSAMQHKR